LFGVLSAHPGESIAFLAEHLALGILEAQGPNERVLLLDIANPAGAAAIFLNINATYSALDAINDAYRCDQSVVDTAFTRHSSGLYVLITISDQAMYWLLLGLAAMVYLVGWFIGRSRLGFALRIIGNDEVVAVHCGINTARAKVILFVISCTFASVTGALVAPRWSYVEPSIAFSPFLSFEVVIMALLGGVHRLWGPLVGVIPFTLLWELISAKFPTQTTMLLGVCFLLIVYFIPRGVVGLLEDLVRGRVGGWAFVKGLFQSRKTDNA